jgi:hypothetical protein
MTKSRRHIMIVVNLFAAVVMAQSPVGFKNPNDISPLKSYRLPTWGYSSLDLYFNVSGNGGKQKSTEAENTNIFNYLSLRPAFTKYHESETSIYSLQSNLSGQYSYWKMQSDSTARNSTNLSQINKDQLYSYYIDGSWSHYQTEKSFFKLYGLMQGRLHDSNADLNRLHQIRSTHEFIKDLNHEFRVGYGVGKVRNVTPVIRALRFRERLNAFEKGIALTDANLQDVARHISLYSGYNSVYDRPGKYFSTDLFDIIPDIGNSLSHYEYNNLMELFHEDVGNRLEGWDVVFFMNYANIYQNFNQSQKEQFWGPGGQFRMYHNLSLTQQIGISADLFYGFSAHSNPRNDQQGYFYGVCEYLYNMTDRLLFQSNLSASLYFDKPDDKHYLVWSHVWEQEYRWDNQFQYYIEDGLALISYIRFFQAKDCQINDNLDSAISYQFSLSLKYYLDRKLFK